MKFEVTETEFKQATDRSTIYRYDCYIDDVFMTFGTWREKQELYTVYQHFIKMVLREWKTKYKDKYKYLSNCFHNFFLKDSGSC